MNLDDLDIVYKEPNHQAWWYRIQNGYQCRNPNNKIVGELHITLDEIVTYFWSEYSNVIPSQLIIDWKKNN